MIVRQNDRSGHAPPKNGRSESWENKKMAEVRICSTHWHLYTSSTASTGRTKRLFSSPTKTKSASPRLGQTREIPSWVAALMTIASIGVLRTHPCSGCFNCLSPSYTCTKVAPTPAPFSCISFMMARTCSTLSCTGDLCAGGFKTAGKFFNIFSPLECTIMFVSTRINRLRSLGMRRG